MSITDVITAAADAAAVAWRGGCAALAAVLRGVAGECDPIGDRDSKTLLPGLYRPVGESGTGTCPRDCELAGDCYAGRGYVWVAARRSSGSALAFGVAAVGVGVLSVLRDRHPGRVLVSGDLCRDGAADPEAITALALAGQEVRRVTGEQGDVLYGYTHLRDAAIVASLAESGVVLLRSGLYEPGCAVVYPVSRIDDLREQHPGLRFVACPHATHGTPCRVCAVCHTAPRRGVTVVLEPSGNRAARLTKRLLEAPVGA